MDDKYPYNEQIELFSTSNGLYIIDSPMRIKILNLLREKERKFDEIVVLSGKAKSTVSEHLKRLSEEGVIASRPDPDDARKKIFSIKSEYLGELSREKLFKEDLEKYIHSYLESDGSPFEFFRLLFQTIRVSLVGQGISIDPILHEAGVKVGETLYPSLKDNQDQQFLENIARFWQTHQLGGVEVKSIEPLVINVYDCFECKGLPYLGKTACAFDTGLLKALFSAHYQKPKEVTETKCYATGDDYCSFTIE
ncbi:MAG: ArsR family transcriptional regulator [Methanobacterium sp.]|nr:ArsR family transcriptional regulator [Methanobacterium sp.]